LRIGQRQRERKEDKEDKYFWNRKGIPGRNNGEEKDSDCTDNGRTQQTGKRDVIWKERMKM